MKPTVTMGVAVAVFALTPVIFIACGNSPEEKQAEELQKSAEQVQKGAESVSKGAEDLAKGAADLAAGLGAAFGGDPNVKPVDPVSFRDLIALLPAPAGWEREKPTGERMTSPHRRSESASHDARQRGSQKARGSEVTDVRVDLL
jgi:X-X-X-Leu-X-X-Gly heptad repeat protein